MIRQDYGEDDAAYELRKTKLQQRRDNLMILLKMAGVDRIEMEYDGEGDSGNVNDPVFFNKEDKSFDPGVADVNEVLMDLAYAELPGGWEVNDGSYGTLKFDLNERQLEHEHNERVTEVNTETFETDF